MNADEGAVTRFPIQQGASIPWAMIAPHEMQAIQNHGGQTLARLAERGGLSPCEALAVLDDRAWLWMDDARDELERRRSEYEVPDGS